MRLLRNALLLALAVGAIWLLFWVAGKAGEPAMEKSSMLYVLGNYA